MMMGYNHSDFIGEEDKEDEEDDESKYRWNSIYVTNTALYPSTHLSKISPHLVT
jgi:hypothetical protein